MTITITYRFPSLLDVRPGKQGNLLVEFGGSGSGHQAAAHHEEGEHAGAGGVCAVADEDAEAGEEEAKQDEEGEDVGVHGAPGYL